MLFARASHGLHGMTSIVCVTCASMRRCCLLSNAMVMDICVNGRHKGSWEIDIVLVLGNQHHSSVLIAIISARQTALLDKM